MTVIPEGFRTPRPVRRSPAGDRAGQGPVALVEVPAGLERFDDVPASSPEAPAKTFEFIPFDRIALTTSPAYLVRGVLPRTGLAVIWGPPKCGKSFFASDLLLHVALGWRYRGLRTMQGAVVYAALEGAKGFEARLMAFRQKCLPDDADPVPFLLCPTPLGLIAEHVAFGDGIAKALAGTAPACIAIDTVNRSLVGSESDDRDMAAYITAADYLAKRFACLVVVVHHSGVDASRPRGHTSLAGAVDAQIAVKRDTAGAILATVELSKDFESGAQFTSRLVQVEVGRDDEGETISSCVLEPLVSDGGGDADAARKRLPDKQRLALAALTSLALDKGEPLPPVFGIPGNPRAVKLAAWREELFVRGVLDREASNPRADFIRLKTWLHAKAHIAERESLIWPV